MTDLTDLWLLAGLRVTSGDMELRFLDDARLADLAALAGEGIHDPAVLPFTTAWSTGSPADVARSVLAYQWRARATIVPERWTLELALVRAGEVLGVQSAVGEHFAVVRSAETGSWLGRRHQGQGLGTRMRLMMLHLLFEGFGAERATTAAYEDNVASQAVTRRLGYVPNGSDIVDREGSAVVSRRFVLSRATWAARPVELRPDITLTGVDAAREQLGITPGGPSTSP